MLHLLRLELRRLLEHLRYPIQGVGVHAVKPSVADHVLSPAAEMMAPLSRWPEPTRLILLSDHDILERVSDAVVSAYLEST